MITALELESGLPLQEFMAHVQPQPTGCWYWDGEGDAYGQFKGRPAHRASWELHQGPIPDGNIILHGCHLHGTPDKRGCVNPAHLRPGTSRENARDTARAAARVRPPRPSKEKRYTFNLRLNEYELGLLQTVAKGTDRSMQQEAKRQLVTALEKLAQALLDEGHP